MTRRPPSSIRHDSARAGRSSRVSSKVVSVSKNWAMNGGAARVTGGGRVEARREAQADPGGAVALRGRGLGTGAGEQRAGEQGDEQDGPAQHRPEYTGDAADPWEARAGGSIAPGRR